MHVTDAFDLLVVEDDPEFSEVLYAWLARGGNQVELMANGAAALDALARRSFAIALLDWRMPGLCGAALLREMRALAPEMPIVVLTCNAMDSDAQNALQQGEVVAILTKGVVKLDALSKALAAHALPRENQAAGATPGCPS